VLLPVYTNAFRDTSRRRRVRMKSLPTRQKNVVVLQCHQQRLLDARGELCVPEGDERAVGADVQGVDYRADVPAAVSCGSRSPAAVGAACSDLLVHCSNDIGEATRGPARSATR